MNISVGSVHTILTCHLRMRKITTRWVPHNLTQVQREYRVTIARQLLHRYETEGDNFIDSKVAIDEMWI